MSDIVVQPLTHKAFAPFGDIIDASGVPSMLINAGHCARHHDLAKIDIDTSGRAGISVFHGRPYALPLPLALVERHPLGSQAFVPMSQDPFLIVVAENDGGVPTGLRAFASNGRQGVNYHRGTWHAVLTPIGRDAMFAVIDRVGSGDNLQEYTFDDPPVIVDTRGLFSRAACDD